MPGLKLDLPDPGQIDGDPFAVEAAVLQDLNAGLKAIQAYVESAGKQLSNTERSRILIDDGIADAKDLEAAFGESARAGQIIRLAAAVRAARAIVGSM